MVFSSLTDVEKRLAYGIMLRNFYHYLPSLASVFNLHTNTIHFLKSQSYPKKKWFFCLLKEWKKKNDGQISILALLSAIVKIIKIVKH